MPFLPFNNVTFSYPSSAGPVLSDLTVQFPAGWTGVTGDNGAGKTTLLLLACGLEEPSSGRVRGAGGLYCPQRTDNPPEGMEDFFFSGEREAERLMNRLNIGADFAPRWDTLSHGERKRAQLAAALWKNPPVLALDEPTNHLDRDGRRLIAAALESYEGIGLLVSHDRALLDGLCTACFFIRGGRGVMRPGGITKGLEEEERERLENERRRDNLKAEQKRLAVELDRRRRGVESSKNRFSKRFIDPKDHAAKGKINLAKLSGKDAVDARLYTNMRRRADRVEETLESVRPAGERKKGVTLNTEKAGGGRIFWSAAGSAALGQNRALRFPELVILPGDRVALTGPNGAGKSTLIARILSLLPPGIRAKTLYVPQEIPAEAGADLLGGILAEDDKTRGEIVARFSRLGSDPAGLLQSRLPSPGEVRKLLIARGVFMSPVFVVMDEPTNHLDLTSIRLLEEMLADVEAALLLVSHDEVFLSKLTDKRWDITAQGELAVR